MKILYRFFPRFWWVAVLINLIRILLMTFSMIHFGILFRQQKGRYYGYYSVKKENELKTEEKKIISIEG